MSTPDHGKIQIAPSTDSILAEIARENMDWETALGEVIDNALDAVATRVVVLIDKKTRRVRVTDNGTGCSEPHSMFVSGYSTKRGRKDVLGRYGVGLKHASFWLCGKDGATMALSSHKGVHRFVRVVWNDLLESGRWEIDAPQELTDADVVDRLPDRCGTQITFDNLTPGRGFPNKDQLAGVMRKLAFTFSPALRSGRQIEFRVDGKPMPLCAPADPVWQKSIEFTVAIDKHTARCRVGILAPNDLSGRSGLSFCFGHRVIVADCAHGCGPFSKQGFAGTVTLDEHWNLGQHKSQVIDALWSELGDAILVHTQPMLEELANEMRTVQSDALRVKTAVVLNDLLGKKLGKPKRPDKHGEKRNRNRRGTDRPIKDATVIGGDGHVRGRPKGGTGLTIDWVDAPEYAWAAQAEITSNRVYLNRSKLWVANAIAGENSDMLALIAAGQWCAAIAADTSPLLAAGLYGDMMGEFLSSPATVAIAGKDAQ